MTMNPAQVRVIDPILTNVAQGYRHPERVGHVLFPRVTVRQRGGQVIEFGKESFKRHKTRRAPGANTRRLQVGYEGKPFALVQDALEGQVPWEHMQDANQVPGIDLGTQAVNEVMDILTLSLEIEKANKATNPDNYPDENTMSLGSGEYWDDYDTPSDPLAQVDDARESVRQKVGIRPNVMLVSAKGFAALSRHPKVVERFKYTSSDSITAEMIARLLQLRRVAVGDAVYMEDGATNMTDVWGNSAVLAYVPPQISSRRQPSYGYTYTLNGHPLTEEPYNDRNSKSWIYPVTYEREPVLSGIDSGFLIQNLTQ